MLPLFKVLTLLIKVFSRPAVNYTKKIQMNHITDEKKRSREFFIYLGNRFHVIESRINRKLLNISDVSDLKIKKLNSEAALEKGIDYFYEILFYLVLLTVPLIEFAKTQRENEKKVNEINEKIRHLEKNIENTKGALQNQSQRIKGQMKEIKKIVEGFSEQANEFELHQNGKIIRLSDEIRVSLNFTKEHIIQILEDKQKIEETMEKINISSLKSNE